METPHATPELQHFARLVDRYQELTGQLARAWEDVPADVLGDTYGLPKSFDEVAATISGWSIGGSREMIQTKCSECGDVIEGHPYENGIFAADIICGECEWDNDARRGYADFLELKGAERALYLTLAADPKRVFSREELARALGTTAREVDHAAARLSRKVREESGGREVVNIWGVGYRYNDEV